MSRIPWALACCLVVGCTGGERDGASGPAGKPTPEEVARVGALWVSCIADASASSWARQVWEQGLEGGDLDLWESARCLASAGGGCDALTTCLGAEVSSPIGCTPGCDGTKAVFCDDLTFTFDCAQLGQMCFEVEADVLPCFDSAPASCDPTTFEDACVGGRPQSCRGGVVVAGERCSDAGLICVVDELGYAACSGPDGPCDELGCDGSVMTTCVHGGKVRRDCASLHPEMTCSDVFGEPGCVLGEECGDEFDETCDGSVLTLCNAGRIATVDCADLGFEGCDPRSGCVPNPATCVYEDCYLEHGEACREGSEPACAALEECAAAC